MPRPPSGSLAVIPGKAAEDLSCTGKLLGDTVGGRPEAAIWSGEREIFTS
jgi:hypothetical protein